MQQPHVFFGKVCGLGGLHVKHAMELVGVKNRQCQRRRRSLQNGSRHFLAGEIARHANLPAASHFADDAFAQGQAPPQGASPAAGFRLDDDFLSRIVEQSDANVVKGKAAFQLFGHSG